MKLFEFIETKIPIVEIFNSISGEGISSGNIVTFVRTAGCNLRCSYCDTEYSYDEQGSNLVFLTPKEILEQIKIFNCNNVICTGGEPLELNKAKRYLPIYLSKSGYNVRIETNGSCPLYSKNELEEYTKGNSINVSYSLDVKCPDSRMSDFNIFSDNFSKLKQGDELKFVVASEEDLDYAYRIIEEYKSYFVHKRIIINFSPVFTIMSPIDLVEKLKKKNLYFNKNQLNIRLSLQLHKYIWNADTRGV